MLAALAFMFTACEKPPQDEEDNKDNTEQTTGDEEQKPGEGEENPGDTDNPGGGEEENPGGGEDDQPQDTKTYLLVGLEEGGVKDSWSEGDQITLTSLSGTDYTYDFVDMADGKARFWSENAMLEEVMDGGFYASYGCTNLTLGTENASFDLPHTTNRFISDPLVGYGEGNEVTLRHLVGHIGVSISGAEEVTEVRLTTLGSESRMLSGNGWSYSITGDNNLDFSIPAATAKRSGSVALSNIGQKDVYYLPVPPGSYPDGFQLTVTTADGLVMTKDLAEAVEIERAEAKTIANVSFRANTVLFPNVDLWNDGAVYWESAWKKSNADDNIKEGNYALYISASGDKTVYFQSGVTTNNYSIFPEEGLDTKSTIEGAKLVFWMWFKDPSPFFSSDAMRTYGMHVELSSSHTNDANESQMNFYDKIPTEANQWVRVVVPIKDGTITDANKAKVTDPAEYAENLDLSSIKRIRFHSNHSLKSYPFESESSFAIRLDDIRVIEGEF